MRYITTFFLVNVCIACASITPSVSPGKSEYVCTNRFFALPESFDVSSVQQAQLLVKANPRRFEAHLILASALLSNKQIEESLHEFKTVDNLASHITDSAVLAGLQYEDLYAFALFIAAEQRFKKAQNELYTLRMLQQVIGMDHSKLEKMGLLSRCYLYISTLYVKRGAYDSAIRNAEIGRNIAKDSNDTENTQLFDSIITTANKLKKGKTPNQ